MTPPASRNAVASYREHCSIRDLYQSLLRTPQDCLERAATLLDTQLDLQAAHDDELPADPQRWDSWLSNRAERSAQGYATYLSERREGAPRRHFANRAHALHFLQAIAPTKRVDGAWLYGVLDHWSDTRLLPLVHTCLEELGHGIPARNHVLVYQRLLDSLGCDAPPDLSDAHYLQGTLQLALGYLSDDYLPEVLGYNLGYELPPLHLMITSCELRELGIDPEYFRLHVTIDNAATGHGRKALQALEANLPQLADRGAFLRRVHAGYRLNDAGLSNQQLLDGFDLGTEVVAMLERKRPFARQMHDDRARIGGRTVNQWMAGPGRMGEFLAALQQLGWIRRHQDPANSRLWGLISGDSAAMFGVFNPYERQLLHDWIAGNWSEPAQRNPWGGSEKASAAPPSARSEFATEERALLNELSTLSPRSRMHRLVALMAPHRHWTPAGLLATRIYTDKLGIEP
ncbi:iron-containing redox enzyme family protein [Pseudomonas sp. PDM20]|uniref:iron-containing redox enzyme family protein n=1 Tax=Pseudomonas sp. PDM20 TaxID=2769254 RepID=UPI00177EBB0E|nr:iron-containing redox enzyme family protein [Pseudomonas sp. PDM20]MBD9683781.1 iron-containing redox enzyme family protein [Pseudomonas sp. PDM20]